MQPISASHLKHELAHALGCLAWGAAEATIHVIPDGAETRAKWPHPPSEIDDLAGIIAGLAYRPDGFDYSEDDAQIEAASPDQRERLLPLAFIVAAQLHRISDSEIATMLTTINSDGCLRFTPEAVH